MNVTATELRLAYSSAKRRGLRVHVYFTSDGVECAVPGQRPPEGYYNVKRTPQVLANRGDVAARRMCLETRGRSPERFVEGPPAGNLYLLDEWTAAANKVIVFQ
jgi:sulfur relay (sulfurtransferase) complex TusBCD TusD component (DsrE family)